ncbi:MAG TPA: hypothetical protein VHC46_03505 [Thermodesulfobacteriota bacterium]|nr:hypothetical protein [Thermodesulfobacteriota bacterium]
MKRIILSVLPAALITLVSIGSIGGCSSGDTCDFRFTEFYNGSSPDTQDSEWSCQNGGQVVFTIAFFGDGTGTRSDAGDFTWNQTKCRSLSLDTASMESADLDDIEGSVQTIGGETVGNLTFEQTSDDLGDITVTCEYVQLAQ